MSVKHVSRSGKVYYLHVKTRKNGQPNFYFSKSADGPSVEAAPDGFEIYENIAGRVFLRRVPKKLISDEELKLTRAALNAHAEKWRYKIDVKKTIITIYETDSPDRWADLLAPWVNPVKAKEYSIRNAHYMAVLRFVLADPDRRIFTGERYCFRGSVDDWINLGSPASLPMLLKKYVKHLGKESFYELF